MSCISCIKQAAGSNFTLRFPNFSVLELETLKVNQKLAQRTDIYESPKFKNIQALQTGNLTYQQDSFPPDALLFLLSY